MKILVANLGSTSFKYRLFDMADERVLARGGVERIGSEQSSCFVDVGGRREEATLAAPDHAAAVRLCLRQLAERQCLRDPSELAAIGFKAVHAQGISGVQRVDERVLAAMEAYADVAPAHNPPYVAAMRLLNKELPHIPLVAAFETGFHETIGDYARYYAVPYEWQEEYARAIENYEMAELKRRSEPLVPSILAGLYRRTGDDENARAAYERALSLSKSKPDQKQFLKALLAMAKAAGLAGERTVLHAFLDGRDTPPRSAQRYVAAVEQSMQEKKAVT